MAEPRATAATVRNLLDVYEARETTGRLAELHDLLVPTLQELSRALEYDRAFVAVMDMQHDGVQGLVGADVPDELVEALCEPGHPPGIMEESLRVGRPVRVDDVLRDSRIPERRREDYADGGLLSFAAVPLAQVPGVLVVSKDGPLTDGEINELLPYAGRLTAAVAERREAVRQRATGERHAVEKEWLWWMANAVPDPLVLFDQDHEILLRNIHAERLLAASPEDSEGKRRAIELNNFLLSAALSTFTLDQGAGLGRELTLVDPIEGNELLFEVIAQPATNLQTGETGLVAMLKDVTDLRRATETLQGTLEELGAAEEHARLERDRLNLVLKNVADPIVVTDAAGEIILRNQPAERLLQVASEEGVAGKAGVHLANEAKLSSFLLQLRLESSPARSGEIQLVDPETGEQLAVSVTATEVLDELGQTSTVVSVLHDLTQIRELERKTVEQQLSESEKMAAVGRLAATVAHEINNPLEAIQNALYLVVSSTPKDDPNYRFLEIADKETQRVSGIIQQMLGFYRPSPIAAASDLNEVIQGAIALLERQLRQHGVAVRYDATEELPPVLAPGDQLRQVFLNLFLNAQEAMPDGGTLSIATRLSRGTDTEFVAGSYAVVQVRDTGTGIAEEHLAHVFEPFYSTKRDSKGTGLGLWVSQGIIQNHGGSMRVSSRSGRGTTFTITLPVGHAE